MNELQETRKLTDKIIRASKVWRACRGRIVNMPMGDPFWRETLDDLSNAEDQLSRLVDEWNS